MRLLSWFVSNPIDTLVELRIGCTAQCPLCGAACAGTVACQNEAVRESNNQRHRTEIHMPTVSYLEAILYWKFRLKKLNFLKLFGALCHKIVFVI